MFLSLFLSLLWPLNSEVLPGDPYLIVNKETNELAYFEDGEKLYHHPVATGKTETLTPEGEFIVIVKAVQPYYRKLDIKGGDPNNPLGSRWIGFDADDTDGRTYGIHGTNNPQSIGKYVSEGCIRMHNEHINKMFEHVRIGTKVWIVKEKTSIDTLAQRKGVLDSTNK
nr:L,D-transpeptidase [Aliibacillus thermotolerans]